MDFWKASAILKRHWTLIAWCVFAAGALSFVFARLTGSGWMATVRFVATPNAVAGDSGSPDTPEGGDPSLATPGKNQATVYDAMVKSRDVLQPALNKAGYKDVEDPAVIVRNIAFKPTSARTYELQVTDSSADRAGLLANTLAKELLRKNSSVYTDKAEELIRLRENQLRMADGELARLRQRYDAIKAQRGVLSDQNGDLDAAMASLKMAQQQQVDAQSKYADAQAQLAQARRELLTIAPTLSVRRPVEVSPLLKQLGDDLAKADSDLTRLRAIYTDEKIEVRKAVAVRDDLRRKYEAEKANQASPFETQPNPNYVAARQRVAQLEQEASGFGAQVRALQASINRATTSARNAGGASGPLGVLAATITQQTEARTTTQNLLNSARTALDAAMRQNPLQALDYVNPVNPPQNTKPGRTKKLVFLAMLAALVFSSGAVIASDAMDRRVKSVTQAEGLLPGPIIAALPHHSAALPSGQAARVTELQPTSLSAEAFRFLGLQALHAYEHMNVRSLMVLSARPGQGATGIVTNLGITLAQAGYRVVVVDANIRAPQIHKIFNVGNEFGFMNLLEQDAGLGRALHPSAANNLNVFRTERKRAEAALLMALQQTSVANLNVIPCGAPPDNPWELFRSPYLSIISKCLSEIADFVIYDTPSALAFTDALNLTPVVDGAFLCVRAGETPTGMEERLIQTLEAAHVIPLGVVLNDVPETELRTAERYQYYETPTAPALSPRNPTADTSRVEAVARRNRPAGPLLDPDDAGATGRNAYIIRDNSSNGAS